MHCINVCESRSCPCTDAETRQIYLKQATLKTEKLSYSSNL